MKAVPEQLENTTFIDIGSGMGRVVLLAARRPYKAVVGVEISPTLHEVARDNLAQFEDEERRCHDIRLVCADAADYRFPRGDLVVYLYNPFRAPVFELMLRHLLSQRREITLLYHTPVERFSIEATEAFDLVDEWPNAAVFRRRSPKSDR